MARLATAREKLVASRPNPVANHWQPHRSQRWALESSYPVFKLQKNLSLIIFTGNPGRMGGLVLQEIQVRGVAKKRLHPSGGLDFFWNNPMWMENAGGITRMENTNNKVQTIKSWWGESNCDVECYIGGSRFSMFGIRSSQQDNDIVSFNGWQWKYLWVWCSFWWAKNKKMDFTVAFPQSGSSSTVFRAN